MIKTKLKKAIVALLIPLIVLPQSFGTAEAATGTWKKNATGYWYAYSDGTYAKKTWLEDGGKWYYFKSNGYMVTGWKQIGKAWYYFGPNTGAMQTGWKQIGGKWYFFKSTGVMLTGWKQQAGKWYYFDASGAMVTGTVTIGGKKYVFDKSGVMTASGNIGNIITFGKYEQDNSTSNGKEAIEWIVLDEKADGSMLVISRYGLDQVAYSKDYKAVTWETSQIRTWLNDTFYKSAFTSAEQGKILSTTLTNEDNPWTGTPGGNNTTDKVFLLSYAEASKYFGEDKVTEQGYTINGNRACKATAYAKAHNIMTYNFESSYYGADMKQFTGCCWWWLRSPGSEARRAQYCANTGDIYYGNFYVYNTDCAVRPAMWIKP
ncbi:MAG: DUF6273 domain-containing protein [Eubacterium sp.]|nr:DUF6273 domain-containing protein [Eubacterium sp.]